MKRTPISKLKLNDAENKRLCQEIADFYLNAREEEIGVIVQQEILDFFMDELAPVIYNKALDDAKKWHKEQLENMDSDYFILYMD